MFDTSPFSAKNHPPKNAPINRRCTRKSEFESHRNWIVSTEKLLCIRFRVHIIWYKKKLNPFLYLKLWLFIMYTYYAQLVEFFSVGNFRECPLLRPSYSINYCRSVSVYTIYNIIKILSITVWDVLKGSEQSRVLHYNIIGARV